MRHLPHLIAQACLFAALSLLTACGDGHGHKDHDHRDHGHAHHHHDHDHSGPNDHVWMDPLRTRRFVYAVGPTLAQTLETTTDRKPVIVASIHPLTSLLQEILGDRATVRTMLPQGTSPHGFEVTPDVVRTIGEADLIVIVGRKLDPWAERAAKNLGRKDVKLVRMIELIAGYEDESIKPLGDDHPLAPRVKAVADKLDAMHERFKLAIKDVKSKELVTFHNAFDLLAERYDLKVVAHLTEMDLPTGAEVTPQQLREVKSAVKEHKLKVLYAEPQYPESALNGLSEATGVSILRLDDIGGPDRPGYANYFEMMETNVKTLVEGQNR